MIYIIVPAALYLLYYQFDEELAAINRRLSHMESQLDEVRSKQHPLV